LDSHVVRQESPSGAQLYPPAQALVVPPSSQPPTPSQVFWLVMVNPVQTGCSQIVPIGTGDVPHPP